MTLGTDREEIVRRFEALLDAALASENPPAGIDADILESVLNDSPVKDQDPTRACDSYALWAAMTALTQEIKLQGRAFQELNHTLTAQTEKIADELRGGVRGAREDAAPRNGTAFPQGNIGRADRSAGPAGAWARVGSGSRRGNRSRGAGRMVPPNASEDPFRASRPARTPRQWAR